MEQRNKRLNITNYVNLRNIFIFLFVLFNIFDAVTTILAAIKHGYEYELNPLFWFITSLPMFIAVIVIFKVLAVSILIYILLVAYKTIRPTTVRYFLVYVFVFITITLAGVSYNNLLYYQSPTEAIGEPISQEIKVDSYVQAIGNLAPIRQYGPDPKNNISQVPIMAIILVINLIQFWVFQSFEIHGWRDRNVERINSYNASPTELGLLEE